MTVFDTPEMLSYLEVELAALVKWAAPLCDVTYQSEGDGQGVFSFAEAIDDELMVHFPGGRINLETGDATIKMKPIINRAIAKVKEGKSGPELEAARAARAAFEARGVRSPATIQETVDKEFGKRRKSTRTAAIKSRRAYSAALTPGQQKAALELAVAAEKAHQDCLDEYNSKLNKLKMAELKVRKAK